MTEDVNFTGSALTLPSNSLAYIDTFDFHLKNNPHYPVFLHTSEDGTTCRRYSYSDLVPAIHRAGNIFRTKIGFNAKGSQKEARPIVAILAETNNLIYLTVILGLIRAGIVPFPVSPRFSSDIIAQLLQSVRPSHIIVNSRVLSAVKNALKAMGVSNCHVPIIISLPVYQDLYPGHQNFEPLAPLLSNPQDVLMIVHSSSSTSACPKAIKWTSGYVSSNALSILYSTQSMCGKIFGCQSAEFFHGAGLCFLFWLTRGGYIMATLSPHIKEAVVPANQDLVLQSFRETMVSHVWVSPRFLEAWSEDPQAVRQLATFDGVIYGGSPLNKLVGDSLAKRGVKLITVYGATECGYISTFITEPQGLDWEYFTLNPGLDTRLEPLSDGIYSVFVVSKRGLHEVAVSNDEWEGRPAYSTSDIMVAHPIKHGYYKVLGRCHDQILLSSGQVVNPREIENYLCSHKSIKSALVFGHARPCIGVLLELSKAVGHHDIWAIIDELNAENPSYAQIRKEMILLATNEKPFHFGQKGLPRRMAIFEEYRDEIDEVYKCYVLPLQLKTRSNGT